MVYRTRCAEQNYIVKLCALDPSAQYKILVDGVIRKMYKGYDLMSKGLELFLENEYRACVVELYKQ